MPVISRFNGITIRMYLRQKEHNPPHIHVIVGDCVGIFSILDGEMYEGNIPPKSRQLVKRFISKYSERLIDMWETQNFETLPPIE